MNLKALKEEKNELLTQKEELLQLAINENRLLTGEEEVRLQEIENAIFKADSEIKKMNDEIRNKTVEIKTEKGEGKMKTKSELRQEFMTALDANKDLSKMEIRAEGGTATTTEQNAGYNIGTGDTPYNSLHKGADSVPTTLEAGIRKAIDFNSNVLGYANIIETSGTHEIVLDASPASEARLVKEGASIATVDSEFVKVKLGAYKYAEIVKFTREVVEDVNFDIIGHASQRLGVSFAKGFEKSTMQGTGSDQPEGLLKPLATADNTDMQKASKQVTASNTTISAKDIVAGYYNLPHECRENAVFVCHPDTLKALAMLQDANGRQLLTDGLVPGVRTLMGCQVVETPYMDKLGTAGKAVAMFVDVKRALTVGIRSDMMVRQLNELYAASDMVALVATVRFDSKVVQPGAISYIVAGTATTGQ